VQVLLSELVGVSQTAPQAAVVVLDDGFDAAVAVVHQSLGCNL
jgi:hypothetical protein